MASLIFSGYDSSGKPKYVNSTETTRNLYGGKTGVTTTINSGVSGSASAIKNQGYTPTSVATVKATTTTPTTTTPTTTSNSSTSDYYSSLLDQFKTQNETARQNALNSIIKQLEATKNSYNNQITSVKDQYNNLVDQNELAKYRAGNILKENQANRGNRNTGLGRQEKLDLNAAYDTQTSSLQNQKAQAVNEIYNLITQAEAEAESNKASVNNTYTNALLQAMLAAA